MRHAPFLSLILDLGDGKFWRLWWPLLSLHCCHFILCLLYFSSFKYSSFLSFSFCLPIESSWPSSAQCSGILGWWVWGRPDFNSLTQGSKIPVSPSTLGLWSARWNHHVVVDLVRSYYKYSYIQSSSDIFFLYSVVCVVVIEESLHRLEEALRLNYA